MMLATKKDMMRFLDLALSEKRWNVIITCEHDDIYETRVFKDGIKTKTVFNYLFTNPPKPGYEKMVKNGFMTPNEVREKEDR